MSGTSADGIDAVVAEIEELPTGLAPRILAHRTFPHRPDLRQVLLKLGEVGPDGTNDRVELLTRAHFALGWALGQAVVDVAKAANISLNSIDLVGSHGQTVRHLPQGEPIAGFSGRSTLQIGEASCIVETCHIPVISDLRVADVAAGGLGAPLVPFADRLLFSRPGRDIALQNFGGIGNVTYVPDPTSDRKLMAFDTGPGNMIMDALVTRLSKGAEGFDANGSRAQRGRVDQSLLSGLLQDPFLSLPPPRTLGREQYGQEFVDRFWNDCDSRGLSGDDRVATATRFTAVATAQSYRRFVFPLGTPEQVVVSGGGALNPVLMADLSTELAPVPVVDSAAHGIPVLAKEALAFAVLAHESVRGRPSNCPEATGASRPVVLGKLTV